jgi:putative membrane protein
MEHDRRTHIDTTGPIQNDHDKRLRTPAWFGVAGVLAALLLIGLAGGGMMMGPGMMLGGPFIFIGLVVLAVWLLRGGQLTDVMSAWDRPRGESARDILDARYARGELSDEEYDSMRRKLG